MAKFPTMDEFAKEVADKVLDDYEYEGKTIREWAELVLKGELTECERQIFAATEKGGKIMRLIDADALRDRMCRQCNVEMSDEPCEPDDCFVRLVIMDMPTIDPESLRPQGEWEEVASSYWRWCPDGARAVTRRTYRCCFCGRGTAIKENYCPNCGAWMKGGADNV